MNCLTRGRTALISSATMFIVLELSVMGGAEAGGRLDALLSGYTIALSLGSSVISFGIAYALAWLYTWSLTWAGEPVLELNPNPEGDSTNPPL